MFLSFVTDFIFIFLQMLKRNKTGNGVRTSIDARFIAAPYSWR